MKSLIVISLLAIALAALQQFNPLYLDYVLVAAVLYRGLYLTVKTLIIDKSYGRTLSVISMAHEANNKAMPTLLVGHTLYNSLLLFVLYSLITSQQPWLAIPFSVGVVLCGLHSKYVSCVANKLVARTHYQYSK